jgi:Mg-chelatase subunit ChlD
MNYQNVHSSSTINLSCVFRKKEIKQRMSKFLIQFGLTIVLTVFFLAFQPQAAQSVDVVQVVDRSGSMRTKDVFNPALTRINAAKIAAFGAILAMPGRDRMGLVSFGKRAIDPQGIPSCDATKDLPLLQLTPVNRVRIAAAMAGLEAERCGAVCTDIEAGLTKGRDTLRDANPQPPKGGQECMILLSDGHHNCHIVKNDPAPDPIFSSAQVLTPIRKDKIRVNTIAVGKKANDQRMVWIAHNTDGKMSNLKNMLDDLVPAVIRAQRACHGGALVLPPWRPFRSPATFLVSPQNGALSIFAYGDYDPLLKGPQVTITDPDNVVVDENYPGTEFGVIDPVNELSIHPDESAGLKRILITSPVAGLWSVEKEPGTSMAMAFADKTPVSLNVSTSQVFYTPNEAMLVYASPAFNGELERGAIVTGSAIDPDGNTHILAFKDDGQHGDDNAGDGVYTARFQGSKTGSYIFRVDVRDGNELLFDVSNDVVAILHNPRVGAPRDFSGTTPNDPNSTATLRLSPLDNDGDGETDEDLFDDIDNDNDGYVDEDWADDRMIEWTSEDSTIGNVQIELTEVDGSWRETETTGVVPGRVIFEHREGDVLLRGNVILGTYHRAVVDLVRDGKRVRYVLQ